MLLLRQKRLQKYKIIINYATFLHKKQRFYSLLHKALCKNQP